jgi:hypothetical protein
MELSPLEKLPIVQPLKNFPALYGTKTLSNYSKCGVYTVESEAGC